MPFSSFAVKCFRFNSFVKVDRAFRKFEVAILSLRRHGTPFCFQKASWIRRESSDLIGSAFSFHIIGLSFRCYWTSDWCIVEFELLWRGRSDTKETWDVPAFHTVIQGGMSNGDMSRTELQKFSLQGMNVKDALDPTGCGNTFCGGFLVGWYRTRNLLTAALWGSVSASFSKPLQSLTAMRTLLSCLHHITRQGVHNLSFFSVLVSIGIAFFLFRVS